MNGGTSLRADGVIIDRAESSIMARFPRPSGSAITRCPAAAAFGRSFQDTLKATRRAPTRDLGSR
jgi:hypothetical protein